ncbi:MAG: hypothetical protein QUS12_13470, partial [Methanosarcina sp.]|nr:hypothetical protein [Methanosarcina sp.]
MIGKIRLLSAFFILLFALLSARLFYWQVVKGKTLAGQAKNQHSVSAITAAPRGNILDADGNPWVARIPAWNVWANPHALKVPAKEAAEELAPILKDEDAEKFDEYVRLVNLLGKDSNWVMLKQKVNEEVKNNVEALGLDGIGFDSIETSFYPEASAAAHVLGFVGKDDEGADVGYFGLEGYYNLPLSGKEGFFGGERDAKGSPILMGNTTEISAVSGVDLLTNINKRVQVL